MDPIGRIFGEATEGRVNFVSMSYYAGKFIQLYNESNKSISIYHILECKTKNKHFTSPEQIRYIHHSENLSKDVIYVYEAKRIASLEGSEVSDTFSPAYPGQQVYPAENDNVSIAYGINKAGIPIGSIAYSQDIKMALDLERIFNPHMLIVGRTGSGKSYFAKGLIRAMQESGWVVLIFSPSDEYNVFNQRIKLISSKDVVFPYSEYAMEHIWGLTANESFKLKKFPLDKTTVYSSYDFARFIADSYTNNFNKRTVKNYSSNQLSLLPNAESAPFPDEYDLPGNISNMIDKIARRKLKFSNRPDAITSIKDSVVFDMSQSSQTEQECLLYVCMQQLLSYKKRGIPEFNKKFLIFIEEAHNYVPSVRSTICKEAIVRTAREGRKHGISLCFITQRPRNFDQTAFSQASNKFIFALPHPDDVHHVLDGATYYSPELVSVIQKQRTGECVIDGDAYRDALSIKIKF